MVVSLRISHLLDLFQICLSPISLWWDMTFYQLSSQQDFPGGSDGKVSAYNAGDPGS